ncbi:MAG: hypothetical protein HZA11_07975 [Nitrospirae bacterium]|nr:hypothetical protein [Nitrospirota bacterium]
MGYKQNFGDTGKRQGPDYFPLFIAFLAILSFGRIWFLRDVVWDDNCWLLSVYSTKNLEGFLNTGYVELRRVLHGTFVYYFLSIHKASDYVYLIWHSINIFIQVSSPIFLYLFLKNLFKGKRLLPLFVSISYILVPLDNTLPYVTAVNYRLATLLVIFSFYLTERAFAGDEVRWSFASASLLSAGFSYYVLMELTIVFEPVRLFVIGYIFYNKKPGLNYLLKKTLLCWTPFFFLGIPLIVYKLVFKPYGIYAGVYNTDFFFFLNWKEHIKIIKILLFQQWKFLLRYINDVKAWSILLGFIAAVSVSPLFKKMMTDKMKEASESGGRPVEILCKGNYGIPLNLTAASFVLGVLFLIFPILMLEFAGRETGLGFNSSHFNQMQIGYAIILGSLIYILYKLSCVSQLKLRYFNLFLAAVIGAGVFFNNLNLDLYFHSWEKQTQFWKSFEKRFPSLPENATFMMDVRDFYYFDSADLDNSYDLELAMNLLYANSADSEKFRNYKVFAFEEFKPEMMEKFRCNQVNEGKMERMTHLGEEKLEPCKFIVVYYRNGELLVNREIKEKHPDISYGRWLDKAFPELPEPVPYPLRHKFKGVDDA